jgi:hypothetical protein
MAILRLPVRHVLVNQPFGVNYLDFYIKLGMKGHNGIDFETRDTTAVLAAHDGFVSFAASYNDGGSKPMKHVEIWSRLGKFKTVYLHLNSYEVKVGDHVMPGQRIGIANSTGKYTTGNHLHFGLKFTDDQGNSLAKDNGYLGAVDPAHYLPRDWDKTPAFFRYGRTRTWALFQLEIKKMIALRAALRRYPTTEEINAVTYGYWDAEAIKNPAMAYNWKYLTKPGFEKGELPFA